MITATITDVSGNVIYHVNFIGFELFLGCVLGGMAALVIWITLKNFAK